MQPRDVDIVAVGLGNAVDPVRAQARHDALQSRPIQPFDPHAGFGEFGRKCSIAASSCRRASVNAPRADKKPCSASHGPEAEVSGWTSGPP